MSRRSHTSYSEYYSSCQCLFCCLFCFTDVVYLFLQKAIQIDMIGIQRHIQRQNDAEFVLSIATLWGEKNAHALLRSFLGRCGLERWSIEWGTNIFRNPNIYLYLFRRWKIICVIKQIYRVFLTISFHFTLWENAPLQQEKHIISSWEYRFHGFLLFNCLNHMKRCFPWGQSASACSVMYGGGGQQAEIGKKWKQTSTIGLVLKDSFNTFIVIIIIRQREKPKFIIVGDSITKKIKRKEINTEACLCEVIPKSNSWKDEISFRAGKNSQPWKNHYTLWNEKFAKNALQALQIKS